LRRPEKTREDDFSQAVFSREAVFLEREDGLFKETLLGRIRLLLRRPEKTTSRKPPFLREAVFSLRVDGFF